MVPSMQQIERYKGDKKYLKLTISQLNKDLERTGIDVEEVGFEVLSFNAILDYLKPQVERLLECHSEKIFALFYIIDIPEKAIRAALNDNGSLGVSHAVTKLIIEREFLKVVTKAYYSQQQQ